MTLRLPDLPVTEALGSLEKALADRGEAVLVAPPGAGKTTLVPLMLLDAPWRGDATILLLEPRRLAARAAARRMASLLGEQPGETVGYAMRMERRISKKTRILVVTEGVLARMIIDDPGLEGIAALVFDEFHERSLDADFGLALALDAQGALRPDLRLLVMSATLDGARVAHLIGDAPVIESAGRAFPVDIRHRPREAGTAMEDAVADAIRTALAEANGGVLAFLPGQREIARTAERLEGRLPADTDLFSLHGGLDGKLQDAAIQPPPNGRRKIVLATAIAETSVTIDGVTTVVDSGMSRLPKYEPATGLTRLETVRVSRAAADQRAGRAGRTAPGVAIRLWRAEQTAALPAFTPPEILQADLTGLVLDCAAFGITRPEELALLDPPPAAALAEARKLLAELDAIDAQGRLTLAGAAMRRLALPVRLAHMVAQAARTSHARAAAELAVLLTERGLGGNDIDIAHRLARFRADRSPRAKAARDLARRLAKAATEEDPHAFRFTNTRPSNAGEEETPGALLLHAYPDRVARARGAPGRFVLANGRGGAIDAGEALAREPWLVVADLQGKAQNARIASAVTVDEADVVEALGERIEESTQTIFDREKKSVQVREIRRLGAITIAAANRPPPTGAAADAAVLEAVRANGLAVLPWDKETGSLRARLGWLHDTLGDPWPAMDDAFLTDRLDDWLAPFLAGDPSLLAIKPSSLRDGLRTLVPHDLQRRVEALAPTHFTAPTGSRVPIRYEGPAPVLAIRVQELFGLSEHPTIAGGTPLTVELLSPAHRPLQTTRDLPGFWHGSWVDVRADMRGRYPKHAWPEDPAGAAPTSRAKPRAK